MTTKQLLEKFSDSFEIDQSKVDPQDLQWQLYESDGPSGAVDGKYILGRAVGPFFLVNGASRNGRFYSKDLWESAISKNDSRMSSRQMLGTIGHDGALTDEALRKGEVSHVVTKLWINESNSMGMGEILILSTDAGRNLNALLRGGVRLAVSSRAAGEYNGKNEAGQNIIDPKSFKLEGFDFVQTPGVAQAYPSLVESLTNELNEKNQGKNMELQQLVESLSAEKVSLQARLEEALEAASQSKAQNESMTQSLDLKTKEVTQLSESLTTAQGELKAANEALEGTKANLAKFESLGTFEQVDEALTKSSDILGQYMAVGSPKEIAEALESSQNILEAFGQLGTPEKIQQVFGIVEQYMELGRPEKIAEALEELNVYEELGTTAEVEQILAIVEEYAKLGTPSQVDAALSKATAFFEAAKRKSNEALVESFGKKYGLDKEAALELVEKFGGQEEAGKFLDRMKSTTQVNERYSVKPTATPTPSQPINENANAVQPTASRAATLMSRFSR